MKDFPYELTAQIILSEAQRPLETPFGSNINIINPFLQLTVPFLKTTQNFSVTILTFGLSNTKSKQFLFKITDETDETNSELVSKVEGNLPNYDSEISSLNLNIDLKNVILKNEGKHKASFYIDGNLIEETNFYVVINEIE